MADLNDLITEMIYYLNKESNEKQKLPEGAATKYYYFTCGQDTGTK